MIPALQSWKSAKAMALLIVLALTIGIGSATAIYTVINTLLLTPVPYQHGERFVSILGAAFHDTKGTSSLTSPDVRDVEQRARSFGVFAWMNYANFNLTAPGLPLYVNAVMVTPRLANQLGVNPASDAGSIPIPSNPPSFSPTPSGAASAPTLRSATNPSPPTSGVLHRRGPRPSTFL